MMCPSGPDSSSVVCHVSIMISFCPLFSVYSPQSHKLWPWTSVAESTRLGPPGWPILNHGKQCVNFSSIWIISRHRLKCQVAFYLSSDYDMSWQYVCHKNHESCHKMLALLCSPCVQTWHPEADAFFTVGPRVKSRRYHCTKAPWASYSIPRILCTMDYGSTNGTSATSFCSQGLNYNL